jgi:hypothetical protein
MVIQELVGRRCSYNHPNASVQEFEMDNTIRLGLSITIMILCLAFATFTVSDSHIGGAVGHGKDDKSINNPLPSGVQSSNGLLETNQMGSKVPTSEELTEIFEQARKMGSYITSKAPERKSERQGEPQSSQRKESLAGGFDLILAQSPALLNEETDRRLEIALFGPEWSALFFDVLGCPRPDPYLPEDGTDTWKARRDLKFQRAISDYPMLGRMSDLYTDIWYSPEDVKRLREECVAVESGTKDPTALEGLRKLILACDKALASGLGLFLVSD